MMRDLKNKNAIYLKAVLFLLIGLVSAGLLLAQNFSPQNVILLGLVIWSFCRLYYFAFYVIENYVDPTFRFSGLYDFGRYLLKRRDHRTAVTHPLLKTTQAGSSASHSSRP